MWRICPLEKTFSAIHHWKWWCFKEKKKVRRHFLILLWNGDAVKFCFWWKKILRSFSELRHLLSFPVFWPVLKCSLKTWTLLHSVLENAWHIRLELGNRYQVISITLFCLPLLIHCKQILSYSSFDFSSWFFHSHGNDLKKYFKR